MEGNNYTTFEKGVSVNLAKAEILFWGVVWKGHLVSS